MFAAVYNISLIAGKLIIWDYHGDMTEWPLHEITQIASYLLLSILNCTIDHPSIVAHFDLDA